MSGDLVVASVQKLTRPEGLVELDRDGKLDTPPVEPYLRSMKTTIEIPDSIARQARLLAAERHTTLRALVIQGLEQVLSEKQVTAKDRAKKLFAAMDKTSGITAAKRLTRADANAR
jgi:hypothetical protein